MTQPHDRLRLSFQTKVLLPVLAALVLIPAVTLWIVDRSISAQLQEEARHTLVAAETVFKQTLDFRARDLLTRFRNAVAEPNYKAMAVLAGSNDPLAHRTIQKFLFNQLDEYGEDFEVLLLTTSEDSSQVATRHANTGSTEGWTKVTSLLTASALQGEAVHGTLEYAGRAYLVVAVPVYNSDRTSQAGALTVATRISDGALQELKLLTGAEILLLADNTISASSLHESDLAGVLPSLLQGGPASGIMPVEIRREHFLALRHHYEGNNGPGGFKYLLLSSYEQRLQERNRNRITLLGISAAGILLGGFMVWMLIRRITHPLVELRDNAEAVGRGDFTRRITRFSNDECGAVAVAFNGMTDNLQASRADLEKAVGSLKTAQAQLIQSEKLSAVGQFVAGVAHELNNPLTSVIGFSDLLQHTELDPKYKEYVSHISKNAIRCHKIVNSLLGFSRQHEPERKELRVNDLADAVIDIIGYDLRSSNITLIKEYEVELPVILGDSHQLQQVVLNIISNARQALDAFRRDGEIILRTGCTDTVVWMRIKDNGPGISRENLAKIFEPFFTTKPQGKGTGLGLSLSYGIMQEHRGRIYAESQPGEGTEFVLELPIAAAGPTPAVLRPKTAPPIAAKTRSLHVLVIDDEESILHLIQEVLSTEGHRVEIATSGMAALELIERNRYDVIVSDWKMPGLNGINLFQELLVKNPVAARRMLFMTGDVIKESFQEFLQKNSRTCLSKPFALREFHLAIARIISPG